MTTRVAAKKKSWTEQILRAKPQQNRSMKLDYRPDGTLHASVPLRRPRWMVPPLSWIVPFSENRSVELDGLGADVLEMCDGKHTVESMVEKFADEHKLSFREAQIPIMEFLRQLTTRGLVAIVGTNEDGKE